jgi:hypothetical protein
MKVKAPPRPPTADPPSPAVVAKIKALGDEFDAVRARLNESHATLLCHPVPAVLDTVAVGEALKKVRAAVGELGRQFGIPAIEPDDL